MQLLPIGASGARLPEPRISHTGAVTKNESGEGGSRSVYVPISSQIRNLIEVKFALGAPCIELYYYYCYDLFTKYGLEERERESLRG